MSATLVLLALASALEVTAPPGCLDDVEVAAAIDEIGGLDVAETVAVTITPVMDTYSLVVDISLLDAPAVHREVPLRPRECADVADLVAVLVQGQRRAALEARLRPPPPVVVPPVKDALPAADPLRKPLEPKGARAAAAPGACDTVRFACLDAGASDAGPLFGNPCEGPLACGGFRGGITFGGAIPLGARLAVDTGYDITDDTTGILVGELYDPINTKRGAASLGLAWRTSFDVVELSARGLFGVGVGERAVRTNSADPAECEPDAPEGAAKALSTTPRTFYGQPTIALRARIGYVFAEAGGFWAVGLDDTPGAYLAIGFSPFGP